MINAIMKEIVLRKNYLKGEAIETIYFGGGTPSLMPAKDIQNILRKITETFEVSSNPEITLEANPDDLNKENIKQFASSGINRLSIGIQSFVERDLIWMNRAHNSREAFESIKRSQDAGIENISIDLIYGVPGLNDKEWISNIHTALELEIKHISSYALTVEKGTALDNYISKGKTKPLDEEQAAAQFEILMEELEKNHFNHYEISNFAKEGFYSRHNSSYWEGKPYLGIGPSAHSFNKEDRQWNIANNHQYLHALADDNIPAHTERLILKDRYNEYLMISLRTSKGVLKNYIENEFGSAQLENLSEQMKEYIGFGWIEEDTLRFKTSNKGKLMADRIASELFILEEEKQ